MARYNYVIIPARFIITVGHILAIATVKNGLSHNIRASLDPQFSSGESNYPYPYPATSDQLYHQDYQSLLSSATSAINLAYVCLALDLFGLICGLTLFMQRVHLFQAGVHFCGSVLTCWFVSESIPAILDPQKYLIALINFYHSHLSVYSMKVQTLWRIVGWTNIPTALVELIVLFSLYWTQTPTYW